MLSRSTTGPELLHLPSETYQAVAQPAVLHSYHMNLVYGSFCPLHQGNKRCPCRSLTTNASLWTAAELGDVDRVRTVITEKGRRPDSLDPHGYTPLHLAAQNGRLAVVLYLLEAGASPDGVPAEAGGCGATPLHRAAFAGQLPCVRALLSAGARPSAVDASFLDMKTPLHKAATEGHRDVCIALLEHGADPNACDAAGNSVLDVLSLALPSAWEELSGVQRGRRGGGADGVIGEQGKGDCSVVGFLKGEEKDWRGLCEALERYGGRRRLDRGHGLGNSGAGDGDGAEGPRRSDVPSAGGARKCGVTGGVDCEKVRAKGIDTPLLSREATASREMVNVADLAAEESEGALTRQASGDTEADTVVGRVDVDAACAAVASAGDESGDVPSVVARARAECQHDRVAARKNSAGVMLGGTSVDHPITWAADGSESAGIPCGECRLPTVVMVRSACCRGLLCKPCLRDVTVRRIKCRRCRDSSGA